MDNKKENRKVSYLTILSYVAGYFLIGGIVKYITGENLSIYVSRFINYIFLISI